MQHLDKYTESMWQAHLSQMLDKFGLDWILEELEELCYNKQFDEGVQEHRWREKHIAILEAKNRLYPSRRD